MRTISTTTSIAIGFACIIVSSVLAAHMFGLLPDRASAVADQRLKLAQVVAAQCSAAADRNDAQTIRSALTVLLANNPDVSSAAIRSPDGKLVVEAGPHSELWNAVAGASNPAALDVAIPIFQNNEKWATVEMHFAGLPDTGVFTNPIIKITLFIGASGFLGSLFFLRKALRHLDPSSVIPDRVRAMLDALAEGVIILDNKEQIIMANEAFCRITGVTLAQVQGHRVSQLPWLAGDNSGETGRDSWLKALRHGAAVRRQSIRLTVATGQQRALVLNVVPVLGTNGSRRGLLATFDDVTPIETTNAQLRVAMDDLAQSRDEIARKNKELELLASHDPLTGCFNRRAFTRRSDESWTKAISAKTPLACIMLDIDFFKQVNDCYGHGVGDEVLRLVGQVLQANCRTDDLVCRYGGEEFCILLPGATFEDAHLAANKMREAILAATWPTSGVTASLGVSGVEAGAKDVRQLLDQADKALYAAKRTGRNRVISWGDPALEGQASVPTEERRGMAAMYRCRQVADALLEALARRDGPTAQHSRRVAELACLMAEGTLDQEETELLRLAGLLHDIGKLAIPDAILHKPGPLTPEEWQVVRKHEAIGADLVDQALDMPGLTELIRYQHSWYNGTPHDAALPLGEKIPIACRMLLIADAYDALVSDRVYRKAASHEQACAELQRVAGTQFDAELVQLFIQRLDTRWLAEHLAGCDVGEAARQVDALTAEVRGIQEIAEQVLGVVRPVDAPGTALADGIQ